MMFPFNLDKEQHATLIMQVLQRYADSFCPDMKRGVITTFKDGSSMCLSVDEDLTKDLESIIGFYANIEEEND